MDVVRSRAQRDRLPGEYEETFFARFYLVFANRNIVQQKPSRTIGFGAKRLSANALECDFRGGDGHAIFVQNNARAISRIGRMDSRRSKNAEGSQYNSE
jgi:hypothetical protein